jgi:hypothetical protein
MLLFGDVVRSKATTIFQTDATPPNIGVTCQHHQLQKHNAITTFSQIHQHNEYVSSLHRENFF